MFPQRGLHRLAASLQDERMFGLVTLALGST
jgi:hypothetical protein